MKYKEHIDFDEQHMKQTIELSKLTLRKKEIKYEQSRMKIWKNIFKIESKKYCTLILLTTLSLSFIAFLSKERFSDQTISLWLPISNAMFIGLYMLCDHMKDTIGDMAELLQCVRLNRAKVFAFKSNIYLMLNVICVLIFNLYFTYSYSFNFLEVVLVSLTPLYFISGIILMIVDKLKSRATILTIYLFIYFPMFIFISNVISGIRMMSKGSMLFVIFLSVCVYCVGMYRHLLLLESKKGDGVWNY